MLSNNLRQIPKKTLKMELTFNIIINQAKLFPVIFWLYILKTNYSRKSFWVFYIVWRLSGVVFQACWNTDSGYFRLPAAIQTWLLTHDTRSCTMSVTTVKIRICIRTFMHSYLKSVLASGSMYVKDCVRS